MEKDNVRKLLDLYFDGDTTLAQERALREYFRSENLPEEFSWCRPLFGYVDQAREDAGTGEKPSRHNVVWRRLWTVAAVAAVLAIALVLPFWLNEAPAGIEVTVGGRNVSDEAMAMEIVDREFSRLQLLSASAGNSICRLEGMVEAAGSAVTELNDRIMEFGNKDNSHE